MQPIVVDLKRALMKPLPGSEAHMKMSPVGRGNTEEYIQTLLTPAKISAVMVLLVETPDMLQLILIKRPSYQGVHSGQVGFPGGKFEESDENYLHTALRETHEEIGLDPDQIEILGNLSRIYIPPSNFIVYPHIGYCKEMPVLKPNVQEVERIVQTDLMVLLDEHIIHQGSFSSGLNSEWKVKAPYFSIEGEKVWGATAAILSELKEILKSIKA